MRRTEVDGVPVYWEKGPEPLSAGLCFGVGKRDESFARGGVTHLVEHLVMGSLPKSHLDRNASVGPKMTEFTATGRPDAVVSFLAQVCDALSDLPTARLSTEASVLAAEEAASGGDVLGQLLLVRYGATGLGLLGMAEPALASLTPEQVREHVSHWFVRENAALWLTGEPPAGLRLTLPSGPAVERPPQRRMPHSYPAQTRYDGPDPALSFEMRRSDSALASLRILLDRLTDRLRHEGGHTYDVDYLGIAMDEGSSHVAFFADAPEKAVAHVLTGMWETLHELAEQGPTQAEMAHDLEGFREFLEDPRAVQETVMTAVARHLDGRPQVSNDEQLAALESITAADVAQALQPALSTLLVLVPDVAPPDVLPMVPELSLDKAQPLTGQEWKRRLGSGVPRGARLVTNDEGVSLLAPQWQLTVRYADCLAVGVEEGDHRHIDLVGGDGSTISLCEQDWRGGERLLEQVTAAVSAVPTFPVPSESSEHGR